MQQKHISQPLHQHNTQLFKNMIGGIKGIYIAPSAGAPMQAVTEVRAIAGQGLEGDRYVTGDGSFNKGNRGIRQVTLMNAMFFPGSGFEFGDSRRNLFVEGVELNWLIGRKFTIGTAVFRGVKYCDPCDRPSKLAQKPTSFKQVFFDRGGLVARVIKSGVIRLGDVVIPPKKRY